MRKFIVVLCAVFAFFTPAAFAAPDKEYTFTDIKNELNTKSLAEIRKTLTACADLMSFDIHDYDYDRVFKYVLFTHENFSILTDIEPESGESSSLAYNNVSLVSVQYIDFIMTQILGITPEKPNVSSLIERGFCASGNYYLYTGGFGVYFATEIGDIKNVYDIGGAMLVLFTDTYREGDTKTNEQSYAILTEREDGYTLLRLGMGAAPPAQDVVHTYSPYYAFEQNSWDIGDTKNNRDTKKREALLSVLIALTSLGAAGLIACIVILIKMRR